MNLHWNFSDESLKAFYEQWGEITDVVVIKDKYSQKSKGFGYVTYKVCNDLYVWLISLTTL